MKVNKKTTRAARRLFRLAVVDGRLDQNRVRQMARWLASSGRRGALPLLAGFKRLVRLDCERHAALVESAAPLEAGLQADIRAGLERGYGPDLELSFRENPDLIGGVRVQVGSDVYDGSVRARLAALMTQL